MLEERPQIVINIPFGDETLNINALKNNVGWWVRLRPEARGLSFSDPEWFIESVDEPNKIVRITLPATGHFVEMQGDHIHSFMKDPQRRGPARQYCFLILRVELTVDEFKVHCEPLPPSSPGVSKWTTGDKVVNDSYLDRSGLRQEYSTLRWSNADKVANLEAKGYRIVCEEDRVNRVEYRLVHQNGQVLVGKT